MNKKTYFMELFDSTNAKKELESFYKQFRYEIYRKNK